jgi:diguanylate cyclase (GGDEF)-like protein
LTLPLAALTLIFAATSVAAWAADSFTELSTLWVFAAGILAFGSFAIHFWKTGSLELERLEGIGKRDTLTNLPNRLAFHADFTGHETKGAEIAAALIDLDGFLNVNEQYGHIVGDRAIFECAKIIQKVCAGEATVYRLGGDEFAVLCSGDVAGTILEGLCRKTVEQLSQPIKVDDRQLSMGASIGLARMTSAMPSGSLELLRQADVAMYASKRGGKGRCTWFSQEFDVTREQARELDNELRGALANSEFDLAYQPLVDSQTKDIVAVEALIRWNRKNADPIGPNVFIPAAEQSGLINPIGLWVLRRACLDALKWGDIKLSVNISAAQLRNPEFPIQLGQILEETGFPARQLELEITETCLVMDPVLAERSLAVIKGFGVSIALDDFGTGYASIGFLRQFRFEKLKLDRSLVVQAGQDAGSRAMMLSSITVARSLKMAVTAEGVETNKQADMVRAAGCDQIQGYLFFKPMPGSELSKLLSEDIKTPLADKSKEAHSA